MSAIGGSNFALTANGSDAVLGHKKFSLDFLWTAEKTPRGTFLRHLSSGQYLAASGLKAVAAQLPDVFGEKTAMLHNWQAAPVQLAPYDESDPYQLWGLQDLGGIMAINTGPYWNQKLNVPYGDLPAHDRGRRSAQPPHRGPQGAARPAARAGRGGAAVQRAYRGEDGAAVFAHACKLGCEG